MTKYIVILGGVVSGVGKGIVTSSLGKIFQEYGYVVSGLKIDPYINLDAGTLRPTEHGEVWVTCDGGEIDQDLGNYERFLNVEMTKSNSITTGQVYKTVIDKERAGLYNGETVQLIPHITNEIKERIVQAGQGKDILLIEVGGVVGDYENIPFLSALKSLESDVGKHNIVYILVTYMLVPSHIGEMKTKPTQTAIRALMESGVIPDIIVCRGMDPIDDVRKTKLELYQNIKKEFIVSCSDVDNIYKVPYLLEREEIGMKILNKLKLKPNAIPNWLRWNELVDRMSSGQGEVITIAVIGKYLNTGNYQLTDSYISVNEAIKHAAAHLSVRVKLEWLSSTEINLENVSSLSKYSGILIPGGFGSSGVEGKILAIKHARENGIPFLGLCYGMQLAVVEFARHVCGCVGANTTEVDLETPFPVVTMLEEQKCVKQIGGTMRLGAYTNVVKEGSLVKAMYKEFGRLIDDIHVVERHRHRYEVNPKYVERLELGGMVFSGFFEDHTRQTQLMEFLELPKHKFFVATQSHPEFTSSLLNPNPLFLGFVRSCI